MTRLPRNSRFQPMTDLAGYVVFDRADRSYVGGMHQSLESARLAALRLHTNATQARVTDEADRAQWRALSR